MDVAAYRARLAGPEESVPILQERSASRVHVSSTDRTRHRCLHGYGLGGMPKDPQEHVMGQPNARLPHYQTLVVHPDKWPSAPPKLSSRESSVGRVEDLAIKPCART